MLGDELGKVFADELDPVSEQSDVPLGLSLFDDFDPFDLTVSSFIEFITNHMFGESDKQFLVNVGNGSITYGEHNAFSSLVETAQARLKDFSDALAKSPYSKKQ